MMMMALDIALVAIFYRWRRRCYYDDDGTMLLNYKYAESVGLITSEDTRSVIFFINSLIEDKGRIRSLALLK